MDNWNRIITGDAVDVMRGLPSNCIDLVVTSPPYWTAVTYDTDSPIVTDSYEHYIEQLLLVWAECERVLKPNGKLAINTPIMPVPKSVYPDQHTRHLKNINNDIEFSILQKTRFARYSLFVWQKQTSKLMFGSYPSPGNILENNTIEFINVFVKSGKPEKRSQALKDANKLTQEEWVDLTQQVWFMYPEDVSRNKDHPAPFPAKLPGRLMRLYTFGAHGDYPGDVVLDPFCGTGTTCAVAKAMGRRYLGIEISERYAEAARHRIRAAAEAPNLFVGRAKYLSKAELDEMAASGKAGSAEKHKKKTYGRNIHDDKEQISLL
jgi:DNA modification methylase